MDRLGSLLWAPPRPFDADAGKAGRPGSGSVSLASGRSLFELFEEVALRRGDAVAVDDGRASLSYAELVARSTAVADQLADIPPGRPVASLVGPTVDYVAILLGALAAGAPLAPIDPSHPRERLVALLRETRPALVLVSPGGSPDPELLGEGVAWAPLAQVATERPGRRGAAHDLSGIGFTSGSTGRPKGLAYGQAATLAFVRESVRALAIDETDRLISLASLAAGGNLDILATVLTGARVRLLDLKAEGMAEALRVMAQERVTLVSMVPLVFRALLSSPGADAAFGAVRAITMGGDRVTGADVALFRSRLPPGCAIRVTQGSTETAVVFHGVLGPDEALGADDTAPSGWIAHGRRFALIDEEGRPLAAVDGAQGEVVVAARDMASGYWRDGELTPGPFIQMEDGEQLFHTGDVVRISRDGRATFVGRRDRMIKILGLRADLAEIESVLRSHPEIAEAAVVARRDAQTREPRLLAVLCPRDLRSPPSAAAVRSFARGALPPHMAPSDIRLVAAIPRLANYKVDTLALEALEEANAASERVSPASAALAPASSTPPAPIARAVRRAWEGVLGAGSEARSWEAAGGDSLKQLQLLLRLERDLGRRLAFDLFHDDFTAASLAERITNVGASNDATARGPRVFLAPGLGGDEPSLAELRRLLEAEIDFRVLKFPDFDQPERLGDRDAILEDVLDQIEQTQPDGALHLVGYSLGGAVAYEAAQVLMQRGRTVAFLGLIDVTAGFALAEPSRLPSRRSQPFDMRDPLRGLRHRAIQTLFSHLGARPMQRLERWTSRTLGPHRGLYLRQVLLERTRGAAFQGWRPTSYPGPLWLLRADEQPASESRADLGWSALADRLTIVSTPGTHHSLMREGVDALSARLLLALRAASPQP